MFLLPGLRFTFDFEQFFPEGDEDLEQFQEFVKEFETDDNFLLIAVENHPTVFDSSFLNNFHKYCLELRSLPYVTDVQSLTMLRYPVKTPFGYNSLPILHRNRPELFDQDSSMILSDSRFVYNLINKDANALVAAIKNKDTLKLQESIELMDALQLLNEKYKFREIHYLGRADFQKELSNIQKKEIIRTSILSLVLVSIVLFILYRSWLGVVLCLFSIGLGLLLFAGLMALLDREFTAVSALYPILMVIVGTSDVIHIQSKYIDELRKGKEKMAAMLTAIKEIGLATLLTSTTTAIGFATLLTSRVPAIQDFGINAAIGVMLAYITVIFFTTSVMTFFSRNQISKFTSQAGMWNKLLTRSYFFTRYRPRVIIISTIILLGIFLYGIKLISTNYDIQANFPRGARITKDFQYFEEEFAGFRPLEFMIEPQNNYNVDDYAVVAEVNKLSEYLLEYDIIRSSISLATFYKSITRMNRGNAASAYLFPETEEEFTKAQKLVKRARMAEDAVLISKDGKKTRISARMADIGADTVKVIGKAIDNWIASNIDPEIVDVRRTGTGMILVKNADYIRNNILYGLILAIIAVSILMGFLFKSWRMVWIALIPNVFPLILAGAIIGYSGIELEAGVSVVFAIIFGIAVDDTIHFLSKFKLARTAGYNLEDSIKLTYEETGKAIVFTTIILFFGFLLMLFSSNPPSVTVGVLISFTLVGALICDLTLLPLLLRSYIKE